MHIFSFLFFTDHGDDLRLDFDDLYDFHTTYILVWRLYMDRVNDIKNMHSSVFFFKNQFTIRNNRYK